MSDAVGAYSNLPNVRPFISMEMTEEDHNTNVYTRQQFLFRWHSLKSG